MSKAKGGPPSPSVREESEDDVRERKKIVFKTLGGIGCGAVTGALLSQTALLPLPVGAATMLFAADFGVVSVAYFSADEILRRRFGKVDAGAGSGGSGGGGSELGPGPLAKPELRGAAAGLAVSPVSAMIFAKAWRPQPATILMHAAALALGGAALGWAPPAFERWRRRTGERIAAEREEEGGIGGAGQQEVPGGLRAQRGPFFGVRRTMAFGGGGSGSESGSESESGSGEEGEKDGAGVREGGGEEGERGRWDWLPVRKISDEEYRRRREATDSGTVPAMPGVGRVGGKGE